MLHIYPRNTLRGLEPFNPDLQTSMVDYSIHSPEYLSYIANRSIVSS